MPATGPFSHGRPPLVRHGIGGGGPQVCMLVATAESCGGHRTQRAFVNMNSERPDEPRSTRRRIPPAVPWACLAVWLAAVAFIPDPRPLSAPEVAVKAVRSVSGRSEPVARAVASVALRGVAFGLLGVLTSWALSGVGLRASLPLGVAVAAALAVLAQGVNYGHFPAAEQLKVSLPTAAAGALVGLAARRSGVALAALAVLVVGLYLWGTSTRISDDLDAAAALTVQHVLAQEGDIRDGDDGFADAVRVAFAFAEDNSHRTDPVQANKAAVLALGIIFGDEKVAKVARRDVDPEWQEPIGVLRQRVTLRGRSDSPRHFWVSAALLVLTDETRATAVGTGKELMDSTPGGSGFSFTDLAANRAGILFALAATRTAESATATQRAVVGDDLRGDDYCPEIADLPEGLSRDRFQAEYGGLAGDRTREVLADIDRRMATRPVLQAGR